MLTDQEKERIRQEEIYRQEVQKSLAEKKSKATSRERLWTFLNSAFGLWLLSTVAVGLITWSYSKFQENRAISLENRQSSQKLNAELAARLHDLRIKVEENMNRLDRATGEQKNIAASALVSDLHYYLRDTPGFTKAGDIINVYPEYKDKTLLQLIYDLQQIAPEDQEAEINEAYTAMQELYDAVSKYNARNDILYDGPIFSETELQDFENLIKDVLMGDKLPESWTIP